MKIRLSHYTCIITCSIFNSYQVPHSFKPVLDELGMDSIYAKRPTKLDGCVLAWWMDRYVKSIICVGGGRVNARENNC